MQKILNELFSNTAVNSCSTINDVEPAINHILALNSELYVDILYQLSLRQKELLIAIAQEGRATHITSGKFIKQYYLNGASSVQKACSVLLDKQLITNDTGVYQVYDRFMQLWLLRR